MQSVPQREHYTLLLLDNWIMLFEEILAVYGENHKTPHTKHTALQFKMTLKCETVQK